MMTTIRRTTMAWLKLIALIALVVGYVPTPASAQSGDEDEPVTLTFAASKQQARPGDQVILALELDISKDKDEDGKTWHVYPPKHLHKGTEVPSSFKPEMPEGFVVGEVQWPSPKDFENLFGDLQPAYGGTVVVYLPIIVPDDAKPGTYPLEAAFEYQACREICLFPTTVALSVELQVVSRDAAVSGEDMTGDALFAGFDPSVWAGLQAGEGVYRDSEGILLDLYILEINLEDMGTLGLLGLLVGVSLLGGFLLNFTPCVLPVIPIKIMGLSQSAGSRGKMLLLGFVMFLGVLSFWGVFGFLFAFLKQFSTVSELFQQWWFTIGVGVIVAAMAVGMCGLFAVRLPNWVYAINPKHDSLHGSFGFGIMTAVLATPCTAPFMGTALAGSTQLEKDWLVLAVFIAIGVGMGFPYLVLAAFPKLVEKVPRTGPGSELLKQVMGLLMLGAAAFFIGTGINVVLSDGTSAPSKFFWWIVGAFVVGAGGWLVVEINRLSPTAAKRIIFSGLGLALVLSGAAGSYALTRKPPIDWVYYTPQALEAALEDDQVVVLDFTADWCNNCHFLEATVLNPKPVSGLLNGDGVVAMKVDITSPSNVAGNALLKEMGGKQIPLLVVLSPDGEPVFKRDWFKASDVVEAVKLARGSE
ncbi:MAG: cytochrome c biogenesis protein CcdA [Phycisphaeraceae bacterium]